MTELDLTIGETSELVGVSPSTLRQWEAQGLVRPNRDARGHRYYGETDVRRLRRIQYWRRTRLNAPAILRLLDEEGRGVDAIAASLVARRSVERMSSDGADYRRRRRAAGLTLRQVSESSDLSISFLSAFERGISGMSPSSEARLVAALDGQAQPSDEPTASIHTVGSARPLELADGVMFEFLTSRRGLLDPQYATLQPGAQSIAEYQHDGEEFIVVLGGTFTLRLRDTDYRMMPLDTIHFSSFERHSWSNNSDEVTELLWVTTERGVWNDRDPRRDDCRPGEQHI